MIEQVTEFEFIDRFRKVDRENNFTYEGRKALYKYLTDLEDDTGQQIEFDVIALCCEYVEYKNLKEYLNDYSTDINKDDFEIDGEFEAEKYEEAVLKEIQDKTTFIKVDEERFIIGCY